MGYVTDWKHIPESEVPCRKCDKVGQIEYREWESSCGGFDDYHYRCKDCGGEWWVEGPDA